MEPVSGGKVPPEGHPLVEAELEDVVTRESFSMRMVI